MLQSWARLTTTCDGAKLLGAVSKGLKHLGDIFDKRGMHKRHSRLLEMAHMEMQHNICYHVSVKAQLIAMLSACWQPLMMVLGCHSVTSLQEVKLSSMNVCFASTLVTLHVSQCCGADLSYLGIVSYLGTLAFRHYTLAPWHLSYISYLSIPFHT